MELHAPAFARTLGLSNVHDVGLLREVYGAASTKPAVLQNGFHAGTGYDGAVRAFCEDKGIVYQSFWTLTANPGLVRAEVVGDVARRVGVGEAVALYALVMGLGRVSVLDGTTSAERMREDLEGVRKVMEWADREGEGWREMMGRFRELLDA